MTPRKPIIYGPDGEPLAIARDRLAPAPSQRAGLEGWVAWGLVDRNGRQVQGGEQHNLILDGFLDAIAAAPTYGAFYTFSSPQRPTLRHFLTHFAVGTGSAEPATSDTALAAEVARTATMTADLSVRPADGVYDLTIEREFDFAAANGNLTEFGFSNGASNPVLVRELFRDSQGNPITVTKTNEFKLRIAYTLTITLAPTVPTPASFTIDGIGVINGNHFWVGGTNTDQANDLRLFSQFIAAAAWGTSGTTGILNAALTSSLISGYTFNSGIGPSNAAASTLTPSSYTPGSHVRKAAVARWSTAVGNVNPGQGLAMRVAGSTGWAFVFDTASRFTKDDLHQLTINDLLTVSWGRA